jgi:predicted CXXCH cytochrome family protein
VTATTRAAVCIGLAAALAAGCNTASHHKTLTKFFDGVPPPKAAPASPDASASSPSGQPAARPPTYMEHGPFAAKACDACHNAAATNALVVPKDQLCARCHQLNQNTKYVHGPLASGGCLVCHDPHSSRFGSLLVADSRTFCFRGHDRDALSRIEEHANPDADCTACHNAHGSDKKYLLR